MIDHPLIAGQHRRGTAREEWEGVLAGGRSFSFRLHDGWACLGVGASDLDAVNDGATVGLRYDERSDVFGSDEDRSDVFDVLLARRLPEAVSALTTRNTEAA